MRKLCNDNDDYLSAMMNKPPNIIIQDLIISSVAVVKYLDGRDLNRHDVNHLTSRLKHEHFVLLPLGMVNHTVLQPVYTLTPENLILLKDLSSTNVGNADDTLRSLLDETLTTVCVDDSVHSDDTLTPEVLSHIFSGPDTPDTTSIHSYKFPEMGVIIFVGPLLFSKIKTYHPVSVSFVDPRFHLHLINEADMNLLEHAAGKRGSYPIEVNYI